MKILVVDDFPILLKELQQVAEQVTREVYPASDTAGALQLIHEHLFDVVITDILFGQNPPKHDARITMAYRDGFAVLKAAKEKDEFCQVIVVTNYGQPELGVAAMNLGAFDYMERGNKNIDFRFMLASKIRRAMEHREGRLALSGQH